MRLCPDLYNEHRLYKYLHNRAQASELDLMPSHRIIPANDYSLPLPPSETIPIPSSPAVPFLPPSSPSREPKSMRMIWLMVRMTALMVWMIVQLRLYVRCKWFRSHVEESTIRPVLALYRRRKR